LNLYLTIQFIEASDEYKKYTMFLYRF